MLAVTFVDANYLTDDVQLLANCISQTQANTEQAKKQLRMLEPVPASR